MNETPAVRVLNRLFEKDPDAAYAFARNQIPCNRALADDPAIVCVGRFSGTGFLTSALGLVNGILAEMGQPLAAAVWSDGGDQGQQKLLGFTECKKP